MWRCHAEQLQKRWIQTIRYKSRVKLHKSNHQARRRKKKLHVELLAMLVFPVGQNTSDYLTIIILFFHESRSSRGTLSSCWVLRASSSAASRSRLRAAKKKSKEKKISILAPACLVSPSMEMAHPILSFIRIELIGNSKSFVLFLKTKYLCLLKRRFSELKSSSWVNLH